MLPCLSWHRSALLAPSESRGNPGHRSSFLCISCIETTIPYPIPRRSCGPAWLANAALPDGSRSQGARCIPPGDGLSAAALAQGPAGSHSRPFSPIHGPWQARKPLGQALTHRSDRSPNSAHAHHHRPGAGAGKGFSNQPPRADGLSGDHTPMLRGLLPAARAAQGSVPAHGCSSSADIAELMWHGEK
jgi:hypothetical protein